MGERYFGDDRGITRANVDKKEVRIARCEVAALKLLDQRPMPVQREE